MIDWHKVATCERPTSATREVFQVRASELCLNGRQSVTSLAEYLQETAIRNAGLLNLGMDNVTQSNLAWVLARLALHVRHYPHRGDTVFVETWFAGTEGRFGKRVYRLYDENSVLIACALSRFALFDLESRKVAVWPDFITERLPHAGDCPLEFESRHLAAPASPEQTYEMRPRLGDIDFFNHVNNTRLIEWAASATAHAIKNPFQPHSMDIVFKRECRLDDILSVACETQDSTCHVTLANSRGDEIIRTHLTY